MEGSVVEGRSSRGGGVDVQRVPENEDEEEAVIV